MRYQWPSYTWLIVAISSNMIWLTTVNGASVGLQGGEASERLVEDTTETYIEEEIVFNMDSVGSYANEVRPDQPYLTGFESAVRAGRFHEVACVAKDGNPAAEVSWTWDGSPVNGRITTTENSNGTYDVTNVLDFDVKSYHNGNVFVCSVTNQAMEDDGELPMEVTGVLEVQYSPIIDVSENDPSLAVFEGNDVTILCNIDANPTVTSYSWSVNFYDVKENDRISIDSDDEDPTLLIESTNSGDKGYYRCHAENAIGDTISDPVLLTVLHSPVCRDHAMERIGVAMGTTGQVECHAEAYPNEGMVFGFSIDGSTWEYENGVRYYDDDPNYGYATFSYDASSESDYKTVQCKASNGVGEMTGTCMIQITAPGPAEPPEICEMKDMTAESMKFECYEVFRGGSTAYYALQMAVSGYFVDVFNTSVPYYSLTNLEPETTYFFRVCASNAEYWEDLTCSDQFSFTTLNGTRAAEVGGEPSTVNKRVPLIAGGTVLMLLLLATFVSILCVWKLCGDDEEREAQEVSLKELAGQSVRCNSIPEVDEPVPGSSDETVAVPEVVYAQVNKATKSTKTKPKSTNEDDHVEVDIEDLEGIYDKADYIKRKSQASLGVAAAMAANEIDESRNSSEQGSDVADDSNKDDASSSGSSSNVSRRSSIRSQAEYVVNDATKGETDSKRSSKLSKEESLGSNDSGSAKECVRSKVESALSDSEKEQLSRQSFRSSEHGSENDAFCDDD